MTIFSIGEQIWKLLKLLLDLTVKRGSPCYFKYCLLLSAITYEMVCRNSAINKKKVARLNFAPKEPRSPIE
jgi:hypothetical protein